MECQLHKEFAQAREEGQLINGRWFLIHARAIYRLLHPRRISQDETTGRFTYTLFSFSSTWFSGFRKRYRIKMRSRPNKHRNTQRTSVTRLLHGYSLIAAILLRILNQTVD